MSHHLNVIIQMNATEQYLPVVLPSGEGGGGGGGRGGGTWVNFCWLCAAGLS